MLVTWLVSVVGLAGRDREEFHRRPQVSNSTSTSTSTSSNIIIYTIIYTIIFWP